MSLLQLQNITKWVGEGEGRTDILRGLSLSIEAGEFLAIMGPSGSGKSTLLNLIGLLDSPSEGSIHLLGHDVSQLKEEALAALRSRSIGFIFQTFNLLPYLTARQNVALPLMYGGQAVSPETIDGLLARVKLTHRVNAYPPTLSGGEKQRVAIARALANEPTLLLADEPTGALDSRTGKQILEFLSELHAAGSTIVLITHDESIARRAQRVLVMRDGVFE